MSDTSVNPSMSPARVSLAVAAVVVAVGALVFVLAHRLGWTVGWIYVGICGAGIAVNLVCLLRWNPELIERRMHLGKGTKTWDVVWLVLFSAVLIAVYVVAVREPDDAASGPPGTLWLVGLTVFAPGWALIAWSMAVNPFFEKTVRIQTEHGHRVIGWLISTPLLLASTLAFFPALLAVAALVVRTALEDRTLKAELPGYVDYAARVRFRLIPGVW
jgi:protein-S-isoprenylcysteine O-methyltransferase Ste14